MTCLLFYKLKLNSIFFSRSKS